MSYISPVQTSSSPSMTQYSIAGLNVSVTGGDVYVLGVTIDNVYSADSSLGAGDMGGTVGANGNSADYFVWSNDSGNGALLLANWNSTGCANGTGGCGQAAFLADFSSAVPEPASLTLLATGLAALVKRRSRHPPARE